MRSRVALALLLAVVLAVAGSGAGHASRARTAEVLGPHLGSALDEIEWALDHEESADDAFHIGGHLADYYADGQLDDALGHLQYALSDLADAVSAGEIDAGAAQHISDHIHEAASEDLDALDTIEHGGTVAHALFHVHNAEDDKNIAGDLIYYGEAVVTGSLGCTLNFSPRATNLFVGFDGCTSPVKKLVIDAGFLPLGSQGYIGTGSQVIGTVPCTQKNWMITCVPSQPVVAPQYIFVQFGPAPSTLTQAKALAFGTNGTVQIAPFTFGTGRATTDLGLKQSLYQITPRGLTTPKKVGGDSTLGLGLRYGFDFSVGNYGTSSATSASVKILLPDGFKTLGTYPNTCRQSGATLSCPLGTVDPTDGRAVIVWGLFTTAGSRNVEASISSDAAEPSSDPNANTVTAAIKAYGVPTAVIDRLSTSILRGGRGMILGHALPGATFEPLKERVTKVEVGVLRLTNTGGKCDWLNGAGGFTASAPNIGACDKAIWLPAAGTSQWTLSLSKSLPIGKYELFSRATNAAGLNGSFFSVQARSEVRLQVTGH